MTEKIDLSDKFREAELGMIHPFNNSSFHIRDNGIIDLFAETNNGARIDPIEQSISLYSNFIRNKANDFLAIIYNNARWEVVNKFEVNSQNEILLNDKNRIKINSDGTCEIIVKDKTTIKTGTLDIESDGRINVSSGSNMHFSANNYYFD